MTRISINGYEPGRVAEVVAKARELWPGESDEWIAAWLRRLAWYVEHRGDMTSAPGFPEGE
jgi:hypothetical protein